MMCMGVRVCICVHVHMCVTLFTAPRICLCCLDAIILVSCVSLLQKHVGVIIPSY